MLSVWRNCWRVNLPFYSTTQLTFKRCLVSHPKQQKCKVTICGGSGRLGHMLAFLLKQSPMITELALYDTHRDVHFLGSELLNIDTRCFVSSYHGPSSLREALRETDVVVITASANKQIHDAKRDVFNVNVPIITSIGRCVSEECPNALIAIATNPVNSLIPVFSEVCKSMGIYNPNKIFGVTTLDCVRACTLYARYFNLMPEEVLVPVVGGFSRDTMVPLFSQAIPPVDNFSEDVGMHLTNTLKKYKEKNLEYKALTGAFALARFVTSLLKALNGETNVTECAYIASTAAEDVAYISTPIVLDENGVNENFGIPYDINDYERNLLHSSILHLQREINLAYRYVQSQDYEMEVSKVKFM